MDMGLHQDFFRPVWRRVVTVASVFVWALLEVFIGDDLWAVLMGGLGVFATWQLFFVPFPDEVDSD